MLLFPERLPRKLLQKVLRNHASRTTFSQKQKQKNNSLPFVTFAAIPPCLCLPISAARAFPFAQWAKCCDIFGAAG